MPSFTLPSVIAHRGASAYAPENTAAAMLEASKRGADWVEFDCRLSRDLGVVIMHDRSLKRTTGVRGQVQNWNTSDLTELDAGSWFAKQHSGENIPTLEQILPLLEQQNLGANIEIKTPAKQAEIAIREIISLLETTSTALQHKILISSSCQKTLDLMCKYAPSYPCGYIIHKWPRLLRKKLHNKSYYSIHLNRKILNKNRVKLLIDMGFKVLAYTVNDKKTAEKLFSWGVASVFSDKPDLLID